MRALDDITKDQLRSDIPDFREGDTVRVSVRVVDYKEAKGGKQERRERLQAYEGVVIDYLRADRNIFLNTEYCIQLDPGKDLQKDRHWFCDGVALEFSTKTVFLCEISYASNLTALFNRLKAWHKNWSAIREALERDSSLSVLSSSTSSPEPWKVRPWLFVPFIPEEPKKYGALLVEKLAPVKSVLRPRITPLEMVQPWNYDWNRNGENKDSKLHYRVPEDMCD